MPIVTASGARFFIGDTVECNSLEEYDTQSWIEVGEVEDLGEFGDQAEDVKFVSLADERMRHIKGPRDAGTMPVTCGQDDSDEGQDAMIAAEASPLNFNFRVQLNNPQTLGGEGAEHFFRGKVMSKRLNVGNASNVVRHNFQVGIDSAIIPRKAT